MWLDDPFVLAVLEKLCETKNYVKRLVEGFLFSPFPSKSSNQRAIISEIIYSVNWVICVMRSRAKTSGRTCGELIALVAYYPRDDSVKGAWGCMTVPLGRWRHDNGCAEWALHMPSSEI
ncbi:hypothetical protein GPK37_04995 [Cutibacterium acnes]|uniref:hypothetical protein n=1 Tax=Cutibacterium acnes TaxID=1747 RepID=UPI001C0105EE|nr:hypothetical protein [Cutibacterium acnes]MBT9633142.1 hypothetical protein [Cutibacterium acnes]